MSPQRTGSNLSISADGSPGAAGGTGEGGVAVPSRTRRGDALKPYWFLLSALVHTAVAANSAFFAGEGRYAAPPAPEIAVELVAPEAAALEAPPSRIEQIAPHREPRVPTATGSHPPAATVPAPPPSRTANVPPAAPTPGAGAPPETARLQGGKNDLQVTGQHDERLPPVAVPVASGEGGAGKDGGVPPRTGAGGTAAPRQPVDAPARQPYLSACRLLIERHKEYPLMARRGRVEGTVVVAAVLVRDGTLIRSRVAVSSGSLLLDNAALRSVRSVSRFPPLPEGFGDLLDFSVPVSFRLSSR